MTNPPSSDDPSQWSRPDLGAPPQAQPGAPTERLHGAPGADARPTEQFNQPAEQATEQFSRPRAEPVTHAPPPVQDTAAVKENIVRRYLKDPLSIVLVLVIVVALAVAGLLGGELFARKRANSIVSQVVSCVVQDEATASFGVTPPFLWQHVRNRYTNISIESAGNQIRDAKGMKLNLDLHDVHVTDSGGTIGTMTATVDWSADGIKRSLQDAIPFVGGFIGNVRTSAASGTLEIDAGLGSITARPQVIDREFHLEIINLSGLGMTWPREALQGPLDAYTSGLTDDYPMDIQADSLEVTDSGVIATFSSHNADIPPSSEDPCFAPLQ